MPRYTNHTTFELVRNIKAFLRLEVGLTRGEVPDSERRHRAQAEKLQQAQGRVKMQAGEIKRLRETLDGERRDASNRQARDYLEGTPFGELVGDGGFEELPEAVRDATLHLKDEVEAVRLSEASAGRFESLKGKKELKLHLGAGADTRVGWVNIDLRTRDQVGVKTRLDAVFINYDLRRGLPIEDGSCSYIYSSHFFEHLEYEHGTRLMRDCHRALRPGGVFRVSLPDFRGLFTRYLQGAGGRTGGKERPANKINLSKMLPGLEPGTETRVDQINHGVYQHGEHKYIYDQEKIMLLLRRIGYSSVVETTYEEGIDPDNEMRRAYSFYVEAVK